MHKLVIHDDEGKTTVVPLIRDEITVGRKEGNTIRLTERNISRKHARILRNNGTVAIEDLNSYNGVRVNGSRIQGRVGLNLSDRIQIGDYVIELKTDAGAVTEPMAEETQPIGAAPDLRASAPMLGVPQAADPKAATTKMSSPSMPKIPATAMLPSVGSVAEPAMPAAVPGVPPQLAPQVGPAPEGGIGRLVILSTNFAGREFELDKPAMVIGRTDDNDLVVNHRSISRHHAKIVQEGGRYSIVDLQSSNGVRVNGEEYTKVELRRGDLIDLGHVRLRFVEPGEDFLFGRDAQAVVLPVGKSRGLIYGVVGLLVIGVIAAVALSMGGDDKGTGEDNKTTNSASNTGDGPAKTPENDEPKQPVLPNAEAEKIKPFIESARGAIDDENWTAAIKAAQEALAIQSDNDEAKQLLSKAEIEQGNENLFKAFQKAAGKKKKDYKEYRDVATTFEAIPSDSIYKNRARDDHDRIRNEYIEQITAEANNLAKKLKCKDLIVLEAKARAIWEAAGDEVAAIECKRAQAQNTVKEKPDPPPDNTNGGGPDDGGDEEPPDTDPKPTKSYDQLMDEARSAAKVGQYGKARRLCNDALKIKPRDIEAATLCGLAACNMKNAKMAKRYQSMVNPQRQQIIRQFCLKAGLRDFQ